MSVLVIRAEPGATRSAAGLARRGFRAVKAPVFSIRPAERIDVDAGGAQALVFTSASGVRAWAAQRAERGLPVLTVGRATAGAARRAGFADVRSADGDAGDLVRLAASALDPSAGALVHVRGVHAAGDLAGALAGAGFAMLEAIAYEAVAAARLPEAARTALTDGELRAVLFHSPRAAAVFTALTDAQGLPPALKRLAAIAISAAAAAALRPADWGRILVADRPDEAALRARVGEALRDA